MTEESSTNESLFARAKELFPGGVNSPVRAFGSVGGTPRFIARAEGPWVWDAEGNRLIDYVSSWGAIILGHADPEVVATIQAAAKRGTSYGAPTPGEIALGERIQAALPGMERMRFTSSGTEAVMSAVRLARAHTGRTKVLKFAGCYHGHSDALLTEAGSGIATLGLPGSAGVPPEVTRDTLVAPYNDVDSVNQLFDQFRGEIAAVLVEPVAANMGLIMPADGFLEQLRARSAEDGAVLVFDEVITGFRVGAGGAQTRFGVTPDLTCLGKIIGGGLPVGAFGGPDDIMKHVAPDGGMYQAGTLSGNPLAMAAGAAALKRLADPAVFETLEARTRSLASGLEEVAGDRACVAQVGSLLTLFFRHAPPRDYEEAQEGDSEAFARFFHAMLERGVALPPSSFEAWFVTLAHAEEQIEDTVRLAAEAFEETS